MTHCKTELSS